MPHALTLRLGVFQFALDAFGQIDILVSNAAVNPASGPILEMPESAIDKILNINIKSAILLTKAVAEHLPQVINGTHGTPLML